MKLRKIKNNKKTQIKMFENVGVMIVFFFLLSFGLIFYGNYQQQSIRNMDFEFKVENVIKSSRRITNLPELKCSGKISHNCIDSFKLEEFKKLIKEDGDGYDYYYNIFVKGTVILERIYPEQKSEIIYNNPLKRRRGDWYKNMTNVIPVSIHYSSDEKYGFGVLYISSHIGKGI